MRHLPRLLPRKSTGFGAFDLRYPLLSRRFCFPVGRVRFVQTLKSAKNPRSAAGRARQPLLSMTTRRGATPSRTSRRSVTQPDEKASGRAAVAVRQKQGSGLTTPGRTMALPTRRSYAGLCWTPLAAFGLP